MEHTASVVFVVLGLLSPFRGRNNFIRRSVDLKAYIIVLLLQIFNTKYYIPFKISATGLFLK